MALFFAFGVQAEGPSRSRWRGKLPVAGRLVYFCTLPIRLRGRGSFPVSGFVFSRSAGAEKREWCGCKKFAGVRLLLFRTRRQIF